jgi:Divergent InlB B-repeat domain
LTGRWRGAAVALATLAVTAAAGTVPGNAVAAPWCGTTTTKDRPPSVAGRSIRVVYAYPSDGLDRSAQLAGRISADIDEIDAWWRGQDALREPRFDRASFACGPQADILVLRLTDGASRLRASDRYERITDAVLLATGHSQYEKQLVYYDGPVDDVAACGEGGGRADGEGAGVVYLGACSDVPSAAVAAHELVHALGALPRSGPPHACPDTPGHPCDSTLDLLYPYASSVPLGSLALDVGHDDYYGHSGSWLDIQDSLWLRLVNQQLRLALAITGKGSVESDVPGIDCAASCATEWDAGSAVSLEALPADGQRFVGWSGSCAGSSRCDVSLTAAASVGVLFAPARLGLVIAVSGGGAVSGAGTPCRVARCSRTATSYTPLRLRATPAAGWRLAGWSGACAGRTSTCTVPMRKATAVRARFVKR